MELREQVAFAACWKCGAAIPHGGSGQQCLACLLRLGFKTEEEDEWSEEEFAGSPEGWPKLTNFKLLRELGEGGSAIVYAAEQLEPVRREVAVKVIKPGMDSRGVIQRFASEKQALAVMDHPNIARVFDAGTTEAGGAFFAMELVDGEPVTSFSDRKNLTIEERIELFIPICQAVQHAHQKGIIHRDLKPTNVLVAEHDDRPLPKVIDFGIAKATGSRRLTDQTVFTAFEQLIGIPAYMNPEQAELGTVDIDTRTDIYSLGVVLEELLAGARPHADSSFDEMRRRWRDETPLRPSARFGGLTPREQNSIAMHRGTEPDKLRKGLRGDLDCIIMKALASDRALRYPTPTGLAVDLRRYLDGEPVTARAPSTSYVLRKFARRHKPALATAALIAATLIGAAVISTVQAVRARRAEQRAHIETRKSQEVAGFLENILFGAIPNIARGEDTSLLRKILDQSAAKLSRELRDSHEAEARLRQVIAWTYFKLGDAAKAETHMREAVRLYRSLPAEPVGLAGSLNQLTTIVLTHDLAEAEIIGREALALELKLATDPKTSNEERRAVLTYGASLAKVLWQKGKFDEAKSISERWLAAQIAAFGEIDPAVAWTLTSLGQNESVHGNFAGAEKYHRRALSIRMRLYGEEDLSVANSLQHVGTAVMRRDRVDEAEPLLRRALSINRKFLDAGHPELAVPLIFLADVQTRRGVLDEAESLSYEIFKLGPKISKARVRSALRVVEALATKLEQRGETARASTLRADAAAAFASSSPAEMADPGNGGDATP